MKNTVKIAFAALMIAVFAAGCTEPVEQIESPELTETAVTEEEVVTDEAGLSYTYTNSNYGFELTFPETWGQVRGQEMPGDTIAISAEDSANRNLDIIMVGVDYKDTVIDTEGTVSTYLGENDSLAFYARVQSCLGGPACSEEEDAVIKDEVSKLSETFVVNEEGVVFATGGYHYYLKADGSFAANKLNRVCFEPAQLETINDGNTFCFTNTEEALSILGIKSTDEDCKYYWGAGTIKIKDLTEKDLDYLKSDPCVEEGSCDFNEAELVEVVELKQSTPECHK